MIFGNTYGYNTETDIMTLFNGMAGIGITPTSKLMVKDRQDSSFDSGISIVRSANTQTGYINMV